MSQAERVGIEACPGDRLREDGKEGCGLGSGFPGIGQLLLNNSDQTLGSAELGLGEPQWSGPRWWS